MPSRSSLVRWGGLAAVVAGALYVLGALSTALNYPPAYIFTRLHLNAVWGVPLRLLIVGALAGPHARQTGSRPDKKNQMVVLKELLEAGKITPVIDRTYSLSEVPEAIRYLEGGHAQGKVVITV
jgi:NADPH:quinone reductase-like Zn-dependent oxidoreductase